MWPLLLSCVVITDGDIASKVGEGNPDCTSPSTFHADVDGDGFGDPATPLETCSEPPASYVADSTDCDDTAKAVNPAAAEVCNDIDDDCSGAIDDDASDASTWFGDGDEDGLGDAAEAVIACEAPQGFVAAGNDCDDNNDQVGAPTVAYADADADGYGDDATAYDDCDGTGVTEGGDCDDTRADIHPGASEDSCTDPTDYNCDGSIGYDDNDADGLAACQDCDDGDASVTTGSTYYADLDADGAGDESSTTVACALPEGHAASGGDCDDLDAARYPGAAELCDGLDNDCDEATGDDDALGSSWYADADADGYGDAASSVTACDQPGGYSADDRDCDDTSALFNPGAAETDCSDPADYNCDGSTGFDDNDGDGFAACEECDDTDALAYPSAEETCDGSDDDCDGEVDEADAVDPSTWYADADSDGYGDAGTTLDACDAPAGYTADDTDCDDTSPSVNPAALEVCNDLDDDCDGDVDTGAADAPTWYADGDGDGYGDSADTTDSCDAPADHVAVDGDCDDASIAYNPGAEEDDCSDPEDYNCDGATGYADADGDGYAACEDCDDGDASANPGEVEDCTTTADDDCSGSTSDTGASGCSTFYADSDADGYGTTSSQCTCTASGSFTAGNDDDCDDGDADTFPGVASSDSGASCMNDDDGDGYGDVNVSGAVTAGTDCDDAIDSVRPGATETCSSAYDDDCDGSSNDTGAISCTTYYYDADADGFGTASSQCTCSASGDYDAVVDADCDDGDASTFPGVASSESATACMTDGDGDGYGDAAAGSGVTAGSDCDDTLAAVNPAASEACSTSYDDDCDGDSNGVDATGCTTFYLDGDGDGYGTGSAQCACSASGDYVAGVNTDCDDADEGTFPGVASRDSTTACMTDADADGYGSDAPVAGAAAGSDCDDADAASHPAYSGWLGADYPTDCSGDTSRSESSAHYAITSTDSMRYLGTGLAVSDFDGDGRVDVLLSNDPATATGEAFLLLGADCVLGTQTTAAYRGRIWGGGDSPAVVADYDADGSPEVAIGDGGDNDWVLVAGGDLAAGGSTVGEVLGFAAGAPEMVVDGGDLDGDGTEELLVGLNGSVWIFAGDSVTSAVASGIDLGAGDYELTDSGGSYGFGQHVRGMGDVDGDGYADYFLSDVLHDAESGGYDEAGCAGIRLGEATLADHTDSCHGMLAFSVDGATTRDRLGFDAIALDIDGDGQREVAFARTSNGAYGYWGTTVAAGGTATLSDAEILLEYGTASYDYGAPSMVSCDLDGDGADDLVLGNASNWSSSAGGQFGAYLNTTLVLAASGTRLSASANFAGSGNDGLGAMLGCGDSDGDGLDDIWASAPSTDVGSGSYGGAVFGFLAP